MAVTQYKNAIRMTAGNDAVDNGAGNPLLVNTLVLSCGATGGQFLLQGGSTDIAANVIIDVLLPVNGYMEVELDNPIPADGGLFLKAIPATGTLMVYTA
jgi:hypothetical protein